ncbi:nucleotidyltransferase domain-containing protein [Microgenomates group bacterium]|nr:nucleotidyltransferase domain-containing protein [Microgenomates group bacterium]
MDRKKIDRIIKIYLKDLSKRIKVNKAILFGSALSGKYNQDSDIDLLILSSSFAKMDDSERFDLLYSARKNQETQSNPMDIFGLTPDEYFKASHLSVAGEIKETGKEVFSAA